MEHVLEVFMYQTTVKGKGLFQEFLKVMVNRFIPLV